MIAIPKLSHTDSNNFFLLAGPCAIEGHDMAHDIAGHIKELADEFKIPYVFKGSYRKANRTRPDSFTGIGDEKALEILASVSKVYGVPTVTDIHESHEAAIAAQYVDVLQIPAFLCRQTELIEAAAKTGKAVNIKKGQFMSGEAMKFAVEKVLASGNQLAMLTDRGNTFGYGDMVVDFRNIPAMRAHGVPVVMETIAKAAIATGADGIFIETHPMPALAKSDGANMLPLDQLRGLLEKLLAIRHAVNKF